MTCNGGLRLKVAARKSHEGDVFVRAIARVLFAAAYCDGSSALSISGKV